MDMEGRQSALAVIVCGFGGVGKSTLAASALQSLDLHSNDFKFCRVAIDEKTADKTSHIKQLQKDIVYDLEGVKLDFRDPQEGRLKIKEAVKNKRSLLFIDNVVDKDYIQDLLPKNLSSEEQKTGSDAEKQKSKLRILITSRLKNVITELDIICKVHEVDTLCESASLQLLSKTILEDKVAEDKDYDEESLIKEVAHACRGVPLLLSVFGKHLKMERDEDNYQEALDVLRRGNLDRYRDEDLGQKVMFVYHKIKDEEVKEAFLDICAYFHGWEWNLVADIVDSSTLRDLHRRMLVSRSGSGEVIVHDVLRLMGMGMAKSTRFSNLDNLDGFENLKEVKVISLAKDNGLITIQCTQLEAMRQSLRVLMVGDWVTLQGHPSHEAFTNLRYLRVGDITTFPFKDPFKLDKLRVFLNRSKPGMNLSHLPLGLKRISHEVPYVECDKFVKLPFQNLSSLKSFIVKAERQKLVELPEELNLPASLLNLDLNTCKNLPKDMGHLTALESLILDRSDVERLPQGFGKLKKLKHLSMDYCSKLAILSEEFGSLSSLKALSMKNCQNLRALPESLGGLCSVQTLELTGSNLQLLPVSFGGLLSLQTLELEGFINLQLLPESFGELRIDSLKLHSLVKLHHLPSSFGNMSLLKDLRLESCDSLTSLPNSFVQLKMLETLNIIKCTKLSVLPEDFCQLRCLKHMTVEKCHLLKELPHGFGTLPALKTFSLLRCNRFVNLPIDLGELTSLEKLHLLGLPLMSRIPDGFGKLIKLRALSLSSCFQLKTLSDDFENMATLENLGVGGCPELDGAMMEKILKLENCYIALIGGSTKLLNMWEHMRGETEHPIVVHRFRGKEDREELKRATMVALLQGKCMEVKNGTDQLMERSSLLVGLEEGISATVALIMLPIRIESHQQKTLLRFVEMARERAKANGSSELQIVCASKVDLDTERPTPKEEEERAKQGIHEILLLLPKGSAAIPSTESKRVKVLTFCCDTYNPDKLSFFMANVVDMEGRKRFEDMKFTAEDEIREHPPSEIRGPERKHYNKIQNFIESILREGEGQSQSEGVAGESKRRELMEALKGSGIDYLLTDNNTCKVAVDDLHGKTIGLIVCEFRFLECIKLQQIYKDLQQKDSNFIAIWIPADWPEGWGHGTYTRAIQCMPWATFPRPVDVKKKFDDFYRFVILDEDGQIANHDALPLLLGGGVKFYPPTQPTISESFSFMESESCLEFLLREMNIVGRKPMRSKMTFLYMDTPRQWLERKSKLEELTQIHSSFEVLFVGRYWERLRYWLGESHRRLVGKQEYEDAIQDMRWHSLSFSDMLMFWHRHRYLLRNKENELNIMMARLHGFVEQLDDDGWLVLVDKDGVVTRGGYDVVQMMWGEIPEGEGMAMRKVKEELMESVSRGEWSPLVKTFFRDKIENHPLHPPHPISCHFPPENFGCDVCFMPVGNDGGRSYGCRECDWDMCWRCWRTYAKQEVEQLLLAKDN